jgi:hypothetical protein
VHGVAARLAVMRTLHAAPLHGQGAFAHTAIAAIHEKWATS